MLIPKLTFPRRKDILSWGSFDPSKSHRKECVFLADRPKSFLQYLCMRKSNMFSLFRYVSPPSSYFRNLLIFQREERRVYIMQKLDCRIPNWRTFLELMSYFPRLSRDLRKKIFQTAQHAGINFSTHFFSKKPNTKMCEEYERKCL